MKKFITFLKKEWKLVTTVVGVLTIMITLGGVDARYAKTTETNEKLTQADKKKTEEINKAKTEVVQTIAELKKSIELQRDIHRLESTSDQMMKVKILMKTYPKDKELKDEYEELKDKKEKLQEKIEKTSEVK